jgi:hypothetical protein
MPLLSHPDPENLTPIETKIIRLLSDGDLHKRDELMGCIGDPLSKPVNLHYHLVNLRKKLLPLQQTVCCVLRGRERFYRRMVMYVPMSSDTEQEDLNPKRKG